MTLTTSNDGAITLEDGGNANHEEGYVIANLQLRGAGSGAGVFVYIGIAVPSRSRAEDDHAMDTVTVRNNSVYFGAGAHGSGIRLQEEGGSHVVVSNAIQYAGSSEFACFELGLSPSQYAAVDNNLCSYPTPSVSEWVATFGQLSNWQTATGFDIELVEGVDPLFNTPNSLDLAPSSSQSPMVNAGHSTLSSPSDRNGSPRDASPDMGAYEFSN